MSFTLQPAIGKDFINRESTLREMIRTLCDKELHMGFALVGPRRMGKTSILRETARLLEQKKKVVPVYFSLWELVEPNVAVFCRNISLLILDAYKPYLSVKYRLKQLLKVPLTNLIEFFKSVDIHIKILDEIEFSLSQKREPLDYAPLVTKPFQLAEYLARKTSTNSS